MEFSQTAIAAYHALLSQVIVGIHVYGLESSPDSLLGLVDRLHRQLVADAETMTLDDEADLERLVSLFRSSVQSAVQTALESS